MYKWVHMRKVANKSIPTTMTEMRDMMSRDHTGISMKDIMKLNPQQSKYRSTRQKVRMQFISHVLIQNKHCFQKLVNFDNVKNDFTVFFCIMLKRIKSIEIDDTSLEPYISVIEDRHAYMEVRSSPWFLGLEVYYRYVRWKIVDRFCI